MQIVPLGDQAVMVYCEDEAAAAGLAFHIGQIQPAWCVDIVRAYVSVAVFYDISRIDFDAAAAWLREIPDDTSDHTASGRSHSIPCCYDLGLDFEAIQLQTGLTRRQIIDLHSETIYTVHAIGFCPGFPYLGYLPAPLTGVPRLATPRVRVEEGSVGLTGRQTGIYTELRPGGWNIVGRTPLQLVDVRDGYFPLRTGDLVRFEVINESEFQRLKGKRLP